MSQPAKTLILLGVILVIAGALLLALQKLPFSGKLPGDIVIKREKFSFFFPLGTSILLSVIISLILYLLSKSR